MRINDRSKTDFDRAKIKLTGHFDRRPTGRYFEPCDNSNNIGMMMFFELFLLRKIFEFPSGTRTRNLQIAGDALTIELLGLRWLNVGCVSM